jgi:hypothetical protein
MFTGPIFLVRLIATHFSHSFPDHRPAAHVCRHLDRIAPFGSSLERNMPALRTAARQRKELF